MFTIKIEDFQLVLMYVGVGGGGIGHFPLYIEHSAPRGMASPAIIWNSMAKLVENRGAPVKPSYVFEPFFLCLGH